MQRRCHSVKLVFPGTRAASWVTPPFRWAEKKTLGRLKKEQGMQTHAPTSCEKGESVREREREREGDKCCMKSKFLGISLSLFLSCPTSLALSHLYLSPSPPSPHRPRWQLPSGIALKVWAELERDSWDSRSWVKKFTYVGGPLSSSLSLSDTHTLSPSVLSWDCCMTSAILRQSLL